jgi:ABC-type sugar transport system permease subunit
LAVLSFGGGHSEALLASTVPKIAGTVQQAQESVFEARIKVGSTITLGYYTWLVGFRDVDFGYGAAISVSMLIFMSVAMWFYLRLSKEGIYG